MPPHPVSCDHVLVDALSKANRALGFRKKARKALDAQGLDYSYLEYGNYFKEWRRRNALKMWTGWPTFPMVFVNKQFIGGSEELIAMLGNGELQKLAEATA